MTPVCAKCQRADVRLYRIYGNFLRETEIFCNRHIPTHAARNSFVPMVSAEDGDFLSAWGYTSAPEDAVAQWQQLPDADSKGPTWANGRWKD